MCSGRRPARCYRPLFIVDSLCPLTSLNINVQWEIKFASWNNLVALVSFVFPTLQRHPPWASSLVELVLKLMQMQELCQMWAPNSPLAFCHPGIKEEVEPSASPHNSDPLHALPNLPSLAQGEIARLLRRKCEDHLFSNSPSLLSPDGRLIV